MEYKAGNLDYRGKVSGVHTWLVDGKNSLYWHPDWLSIAEDQMGLHPKQPLEVGENEQPTEHHAVSAILKHLNDKLVDGINKINK
ncbi:hypothetical protein L0B53_09510 [Vibrio sp. SS-MA-C1-2]|uniref:hypothetical protein n=1 Tax=Vibrio sp. SS-MA-C1-2 TaxID=2908646 RepID=UPI001F250366|nr:hypothetical protein [Vibrio sp. SS-MA-C1-2]UJF19709.1 hypothetical protein L0B53_09510 [Vibrio sp. SS-MA-C1-2]